MPPSERRAAGWDVRNAFRNYSTLVAAQIAVAVFSFASVWLVTRYLGTEGYGGLVAVIAAAQVALLFVNWTAVALARYGVEEFVRSGSINDSFWARTIILLPNTLVVLAFSFLWLPLLSNWLKLPPEANWYVAAHFVVSAIWLHIQHAIQGAKLPRLQGILLAAERISIFAILCGLIVSNRLDFLSAVAAYIAGPIIMSLIGLWKIRDLFSWRIRIETEWLRKMLRFSVPLIPFSVIGYLSGNYLDAVFISQYLGKSDLGVYSLAYQVSGIVMQFPLLAGSLLMPLFVTLQTGEDTGKVKTFMEEVLPLLAFLGGLICILAAAAGDVFIPLVFRSELHQSASILWILVSSAALVIPGLIGYVPFINASSSTKITLYSSIAAGVTNVAANYLLIERYGLKGVAWATVLAFAASIFTAMYLVHRQTSYRIGWIIPALVPPLAGSAYASLTGNHWQALLLVFVTATAVVFLFKDAFMNSVRRLIEYRRILTVRNEGDN